MNLQYQAESRSRSRSWREWFRVNSAAHRQSKNGASCGYVTQSVFVGYHKESLALVFISSFGVLSVIQFSGRTFRLPDAGAAVIAVGFPTLVFMVTTGLLPQLLPMAIVTTCASVVPKLLAPPTLGQSVFLSAASKNLQPVRRDLFIYSMEN